VLGDHLFARAMEGMLATGLPRATDVARYWLGICRTTAARQYLDLEITGAPLAEVTLFQTLKIALHKTALHKTARYTFVAPLVGGALLGGGDAALCAALDRLGRQLGIAFQLRDDLLGLFGAPERVGKPVGADLAAGKPTFPVVAAYVRATPAGRRELDALWAASRDDADACRRLLAAVEQLGGRAAASRRCPWPPRAGRCSTTS
jgi:geranylgeranyl diphosphate synthase type I